MSELGGNVELRQPHGAASLIDKYLLLVRMNGDEVHQWDVGGWRAHA